MSIVDQSAVVYRCDEYREARAVAYMLDDARPLGPDCAFGTKPDGRGWTIVATRIEPEANWHGIRMAVETIAWMAMGMKPTGRAEGGAA